MATNHHPTSAPAFPRGIEVVGSAVIENPAGQILLVQSPKWGGKWVLPGGHIEPGESILAATVREAQEEVGLALTPLQIVSFGELINSPDFHRPAHFIYFDVWCHATKTEVSPDGREIASVRWVEPKKALEMDLGQSYDHTLRDFLKAREQRLAVGKNGTRKN
ncbi:MAG: NUDIX hydrolase [Parcubacteria group bacterium Gr01-1014_31]|nr:MAG: NUDIX hydrolase [Parcubacteria group bacterium Gr01-1014_31]